MAFPLKQLAAQMFRTRRSKIIFSLLGAPFVICAFIWLTSYAQDWPSIASVGRGHLAASDGYFTIFVGNNPFEGGGLMHDANKVGYVAQTSSGHHAGVYYTINRRPAPFPIYWTVQIPIAYFCGFLAIFPLAYIWFALHRLRNQPPAFPVIEVAKPQT